MKTAAPRPNGESFATRIAPSSSGTKISAATGEEVARPDPDRPGAPASMTKMRLALLVMEAVKDGQLKLSDPIQTSRVASKMGGSQVYLKEGESFSVEEMMAALMIGSANDAAAALAERLAGSVEGAVALMNERAKALKLTKTRFRGPCTACLPPPARRAISRHPGTWRDSGRNW